MAAASQTVQNPSSDSLPQRALREGHGAVQNIKNNDRLANSRVTRAPVVGLIKGIGAALIVAAMVIVVLSMVFGLDIVQNTDGPFGNLTQDFQQYGVAALSLVGIGIIVLGAQFAMDMFGNGGGGGR